MRISDWSSDVCSSDLSEAFARQGGFMEMVQLWVNPPAKDKMAPAGYQTILKGDIPNIELKDNAGSLRLIAGRFEGHQGPAKTFTPTDVWDLRLNAGKNLTLDVHAGHNTALVVLRGTVQVNGRERGEAGQQIGSARWRQRECKYVSIAVAAQY